ncbi:hypothetical protein MKY85_17440 [Paenibacillus sp. FSL R5-0749]|uniref:hypothetical protein n=1 Tax=Paenibacillus sp. FSL R5-0749 TaxID=2921657 RepID=UPI00315AD360
MDLTLTNSTSNLTVNTISTTNTTNTFTNTYTIEKPQDKRKYWNKLVALGLSIAIGSVPTISEQTDLKVKITNANEYGLGDIRNSSTFFNSDSKMEAVEVERQLKSQSAPNVEKLAYHTYEPEIIEVFDDTEDLGYLTFGVTDSSNKLKESPVSSSSIKDIVFLERG